MKIDPCTRALLFLESNAALLKAKKDAEAKGFIFETSRDAIVAKAKQEGAVKVLSGLDPSIYSSIMEGFKKKYPFLKIEILEITGPDSAQRFIMELKSGSRNDFDVSHASTEFYPEYIPFAKKFDLLGMAQTGVLRIPPKMIDPKPGLPARGPWFGVDVEVRKGLARPKPDLVARPQQGFELHTGGRICHSLWNALSIRHESDGQGPDRHAPAQDGRARARAAHSVGARARLGTTSICCDVVYRA